MIGIPTHEAATPKYRTTYPTTPVCATPTTTRTDIGSTSALTASAGPLGRAIPRSVSRVPVPGLGIEPAHERCEPTTVGQAS